MVYKVILLICFLLISVHSFSDQTATTPIPVKAEDLQTYSMKQFISIVLINGITVPVAQSSGPQYSVGLLSELKWDMENPFALSIWGDIYPYAGLGTSVRVYLTPPADFYFGLGVKADYDYTFQKNWNGIGFLESGYKFIFENAADNNKGGFFIEPFIQAGWRNSLNYTGSQYNGQPASSDKGGAVGGNFEISVYIGAGYIFY